MDTLYLYFLAAAMLWLQGGRGVSQFAKSQTCMYTTFKGYSSADCSERNLQEVPIIRKGTEILLANMNRIRKLTNSSFHECTSLKYLYLQDNLIITIEAGAFYELEDLLVLDLSTNGITVLPAYLPKMLRTLYLADNEFLVQNYTLTSAYYLTFLSLAASALRQVPAVGMLPNLKVLNLTYNPLETLTPADLAPFCHLNTIYLPPKLYNTGADTKCQCHRLLTWTSQHYIELPGFKCTTLVDPDKAGCIVDFSPEAAVHNECLQSTPPVSVKRYLLIAAVVSCVVVAFVVLLCWWRKGRRKQNAVQDNRRQPRCLAAEDKKGTDTLIM